MLQLVLAAPRSGSGKTTAACALLAALQARGKYPCAFKSGPDYIDPMFHRSVLGVESHNLDLFFSTQVTVRRLYAQNAAGHGATVVEGATAWAASVPPPVLGIWQTRWACRCCWWCGPRVPA